MPRTRTPTTSRRKLPVQARSSQLVADILEAAIRVLEREGAAQFTTIRIAAAAGVSVGSLYQYFPNKQAILFQLQRDEWATTSATLHAILGDTTRSPRGKEVSDRNLSRRRRVGRRRRRDAVRLPRAPARLTLTDSMVSRPPWRSA